MEKCLSFIIFCLNSFNQTTIIVVLLCKPSINLHKMVTDYMHESAFFFYKKKKNGFVI